MVAINATQAYTSMPTVRRHHHHHHHYYYYSLLIKFEVGLRRIGILKSDVDCRLTAEMMTSLEARQP